MHYQDLFGKLIHNFHLQKRKYLNVLTLRNMEARE